MSNGSSGLFRTKFCICRSGLLHCEPLSIGELLPLSFVGKQAGSYTSYALAATLLILPGWLENAWFSLLKVHTSEGTFMNGGEFFLRFKLSNRFPAASKTKADGLHFGKKIRAGSYPKDNSDCQDGIH